MCIVHSNESTFGNSEWLTDIPCEDTFSSWLFFSCSHKWINHLCSWLMTLTFHQRWVRQRLELMQQMAHTFCIQDTTWTRENTWKEISERTFNSNATCGIRYTIELLIDVVNISSIFFYVQKKTLHRSVDRSRCAICFVLFIFG